MEKFNSIVEPVSEENIKDSDGVKKWLRRHLGLVVMSAVLAYAPEKEVSAQIRTTETVSVGSDHSTIEAERRNAFESFESLVQKGELSEKLDKIKEEFGSVIDGFLESRHISQDLDSLDKLVKGKNDPNAFVNKAGSQFMTPGSVVTNAYKTRWENMQPMNIDGEVSLKNIELVPGLSSQELLSIFEQMYPENYIASIVSSIEFVPNSDVKDGMEILGQTKSFGLDMMATNTSGDLRTPIKINLPTTGIDKDTFLDIFKHEVGHSAGWDNNPRLTSTQRLEMLFDVAGRVSSEDRYISEYVEGINQEALKDRLTGNDTGDEKTQKQNLAYIRAIEYWPEIAKAYFENPSGFQGTNPKDYEVVKKWVDVMSK